MCLAHREFLRPAECDACARVCEQDAEDARERFLTWEGVLAAGAEAFRRSEVMARLERAISLLARDTRPFF